MPTIGIYRRRLAPRSRLNTLFGALRPSIQPDPLVGPASRKSHTTRSTPIRNYNNAQQHNSVRTAGTSSFAQVRTVFQEPIKHARPLSILPISMVLRSLATNVVCSSPTLVSFLLRIMTVMTQSKSPFLDPGRNPVLRLLLKHTIYAQFCAGDSADEVRRTVARLKSIGFTGVILGYAKEAIESDEGTVNTHAAAANDVADVKSREQEISSWASGTIETVRLTDIGDFVAVKFTGAGSLAMHLLGEGLPVNTSLGQAIDSICQVAQERGVRLLIDAEYDHLQDGIDRWTMHFARRYNRSSETPVVYNTYQAYKKCTPAVLSKHLAEAKAHGFSLGVKLVRGAYLSCDPRERLHETKEKTDACYDSIAASVLTRQWSDVVRGSGTYPNTHLVLATHNAESVGRIRTICDAGSAISRVEFAQLHGMADEVSCELVNADASRTESGSSASFPVYKHLAWGNISECMRYLLRRVQENKEALQRARYTREAMLKEVVRRGKSVIFRAGGLLVERDEQQAGRR